MDACVAQLARPELIMSVYLVDHYIEDRREFFRRAFITLGFNGIEGDYAEFGCHSGRTFNLAYLPRAKGPEDSHPFWVEGTLFNEPRGIRRDLRVQRDITR